MIRLIQRRLIIPRGDTGTFSIPVLAGKDTGDTSILTIFDPLTHRKLREKRMELSDGVLTVNFTHGDTVNLPVGQYVWDIKFYSNPVFADDQIIDGEEVDSYYAAFTLPVCEIRETGDNLLMDDDAPQAKLAPGQIDLITAAITEIQAAKEAAANSAAEADTSATNAENSADAASISAQAAQNSEVAAAASQTGAAASASHAASSAVAAEGAAAQAAEIAAQIHEEIPTKVSDLIDDSGHYTKPAGGIPANDIADGVIPILTDLIDDTAGDGDTDKVWSADKITDAFDGLGQDFSHILNVLSSEIHAVNTVAQSKYTKPANGIPAADLEETYLTSFTETDPTVPSWAKAAQKPTYTAQEVGAPTVQQMNTALDEKAEKFTINLTLGEEQTITCDTLIEDIKTAYEEGKIIEGILTRNDGSGINLVLKTIGMAFDLAPVIFMVEFIFDLSAQAKIRITGGINPGSLTEWQIEQDYVMEATDNTDYNAQSKRITYLAAPTANNDAATKQYVDNSTYAWAKAAQKPTYTAAEVGAPTTQEMNTAIATAIGNIHQFDIQVVQALPTQDIQEHTVYFVPKTGDTNDVYDEYIYINNTWEMIGNTQIDLSNYATKSEIPSVPVQDVQVNGISVMVNGIATISQVVTQTNGKYGVMASSGTLYTSPATTNLLKQDYSTASSDDKTKMAYQPITTRRLPDAVFYGLAKAAGDSTQAVSSNAVGTYTDDAKTAILNMFGLQLATDTEVQNIINGGVGA